MILPFRIPRWAAPAALGLALAAPSWAAISVTDVSISPGTGGDIFLKYRLNEAASSVSINLSGGSSVTGATAKGLNTVTLTHAVAGQTATITATAPAEAGGAAGAVLVVPVTTPDNRATPSSTNLVGVDVNKRINSAGNVYGAALGHIYLPTGFNQAGQKYCWVYASDGTMLFNKNLGDVATSGSWPYGMAVAQGDPNDHVVIHNRSLAKNCVFNADLSLTFAAPYNYTNGVPGMCITPNPSDATLKFNIWQAGPKDKGVRRTKADLATAAGFDYNTTTFAIEAGNDGENVHDIAVDLTNAVMFKAQVTDGGVGALSTGGVNKWTSADAGDNWTEDTTWLTAFLNNVTADLAAAGSALTTADLVGGGVGLAPGFNAANMSNSSAWVAVSSSLAVPFFNRIYRVNAATAAIEQTIDVQQIPTPTGGVAIAGKSVRFVEADAVGNLCIGLNAAAAMTGQSSRYFAVLGPNQTGANSASVGGIFISAPPQISVSVDKNVVANTGAITVNFTAQVTDTSGIVADNAQVTADLSAIKGPPSATLVRGAVSADGFSAPYTVSYLVPKDVDLSNSGSFDLPFTLATTSTPSTVARVTVAVYSAYTPAWSLTTDGAVNSSPVTNGVYAYFGDDAGKVYEVNTATGALVSAFGAGGAVTLPEPVKGKLAYDAGKLYVATSGHVYVLNGGTGSILASPAVAGVSSLAVSPLIPNAVFAAAGNTIVKLNATTGAQLAATPDLGAAVNRVSLIPSSANDATQAPAVALVVTGTEGDSTGKNGKIVIASAGNLGAVFSDANSVPTLTPFTDANGPVRSQATFGNDGTINFFAIGGASGLWAVNADAGTLLEWVANSGGGANNGGNPYTPGSPVDADPVVPIVGDGSFGREDTRFAFATAGSASQGGQLNVLTSSVGERASYGGYPVPLTPIGSGFAAGAGLFAVNTADGPRVIYLGSDAVDKRFFAVETEPDDISYSATADKKHIFDPKDTLAFPGAAAGAFNSAPALSGDKVVVGSAARRVYGFASLTAVQPWVTSVTPANGSASATAPASITLTFSGDISTSPIDSSTVKLLDSAGAAVDASPALGADLKSIVITPASPLSLNKTYTVVVDATVSQPFSSSFATALPAVVKGDVNGDGQFNAQDVKDALKMASGLLPATDKAITALNKTKPYSITVGDAVFMDRVLGGKASF
ncbi:MAG TPA: Ig-like domain-containing protein [Armatimonadota bacterium]|jgi:methionine-rich copper-binding protein CopC